MGTSVKSIKEQYGDKKATWYFSGSLNDVSVTGDTFSIPYPAVSAKFVYSGKNQASVDFFYAEPVLTGLSGSYLQVYGLSERAWANDTYKQLSRGASSAAIPAQSTSNYFKASNKTTRTLTFSYLCSHIFCETHRVVSGAYYAEYDGSIQGLSSDFTVASASITLNAPPIVAYDEPIYSTPHYAGLGAYSVTVTSASAQYGGDVKTITLTIGSDSVTQNYSSATITNKTLSLVPSVAGTYTPIITVTDSRGQTTTVNLAPITVNAYTAPSISFDLQRTDDDGVPYAEGEHGLVTANISYTDAIAELTQPTVVVKDEDGNTVVSSATWYETWTAQDGVDDAVNWTSYNPQSPATLYAVVSATGSSLSPSESYTVSIMPTDNQGGVAQTITQTLSTAFFTIDFKAGGKEIAFGAPANDDVTNYPEGLFKCAMSFVNVNMVGEIKAYAGVTVPNGWLECDGSEVLKADYPILYGAIADSWGVASDADHFVLPNMKGRVPVGYDSTQTEFNAVGENGGAKTVTLNVTQMPSHSHGLQMRYNNGTGSVYGVDTPSSPFKYTWAAGRIENTGGGQAHNNLQPYAVVKYIICAV